MGGPFLLKMIFIINILNQNTRSVNKSTEIKQGWAAVKRANRRPEDEAGGWRRNGIRLFYGELVMNGM